MTKESMKGVFSHNSDEWATPQSIFDELNQEFSFDLDVCSTEDNHKCDRYFTKEIDGLSQNWGGAECFAIHHIVKLINGLKRLFTKQNKRIHLLFC